MLNRMQIQLLASAGVSAEILQKAIVGELMLDANVKADSAMRNALDGERNESAVREALKVLEQAGQVLKSSDAMLKNVEPVKRNFGNEGLVGRAHGQRG